MSTIGRERPGLAYLPGLVARTRRRLGDTERGAITVSSVLIWPTLLVLVFTIVQAGLYFHARDIASHAAAAAADAASREGGTQADGQAAAANIFGQAGNGLIDPAAAVVMGGQSVTVTVTGDIPSLVPLPWTISETTSSAVERWEPAP